MLKPLVEVMKELIEFYLYDVNYQGGIRAFASFSNADFVFTEGLHEIHAPIKYAERKIADAGKIEVLIMGNLSIDENEKEFLKEHRKSIADYQQLYEKAKVAFSVYLRSLLPINNPVRPLLVPTLVLKNATVALCEQLDEQYTKDWQELSTVSTPDASNTSKMSC